MDKEKLDNFVNYKVYPNATDVFDLSLESIEKIKNDCIFVIDTNALLVPYSTGSHSLKEINKVFTKLKLQKRIFIPGQVAREFANNRPNKLKQIFQQLNRKQSSVSNLDIGNYPLLEEIESYQNALEIEKAINEKLKEYRKAISSVLKVVKMWNWDDPVSLIYREIFTKETIVDTEFDREKTLSELTYRHNHKIPPGYKDDSKPDDGIGDLLIWFTILELAKAEKHVIFISADEKNDWYHISEGQALYPRFELIAEFKNVSKGKTFQIIKLSEFLNLLGADEDAIKEIEIRERTFSGVAAQRRVYALKAERAVFNWYTNNGIPITQIFNGKLDFAILYDGDKRAGVNVFIINDDLYSPKLLSRRLYNKIFEGYQEAKSRQYNRIIFIFFVDDETYNVIELLNTLNSITTGLDADSIEFKVGILNTENEFSPII
ncbi:MAG: DUF4935 domain-containing protein [Bacteroidetes bacterium]|nr:DUF4935 domain-containing protein [Bacteroidota bacterium]